MREALNGRPPADRTRHDYQRVLNAYRTIYLGAPTSGKADPSVVAVAETLVEMGRRFDDTKILHQAIEQYKFLRREYPGSKYRCDGLFTIGEIYKDDLNDPQAARSTFQDFLRRYPYNRLADDARQAIADLDRQVKDETAAAASPHAEKKPPAKNDDNEADGSDSAPDHHAMQGASGKEERTEAASTHVVRVTGIRHWSTPDYTRVAIDVEGKVRFSSQRIESPARIFFDLRETKLASTLVGKSFDVDDGFLKKIRVARFSPGRTRVVLDVDNLSDYDAFLLPNPYRLIIDIHGKNGTKQQVRGSDEATSAKSDEQPSANAAPTNMNPNSAEAKPAASERADSTNGKAGAATPESNVDDRPPNSRATAEAPKQKTGVVKKVVEADDDDDDVSARAAKRGGKTASTRNSTASAKRAHHDPDTDSDSDADSQPHEAVGAANDSSRKPVSRALASGKQGSGYDSAIHAARPTASGDRSLIRTLGLKIGKIVIDPGHGGHDTGTIGPNGLEEKDLVLDVAHRLGKLLDTRLGADVVYTRKDDTFIPLETRTAIANQARADLFISIHANSSHDSAARGVETYYLNFTSSPEALEVAARENAVSESSIYELQDLVKKIAMKEKIEESREFAGDVQEALHSGLAAKSSAIRDRGVKKAPFIVLIGANMPSILAEISFVSNPTDERRLETAEYRQRIAESLYRGIAKYANGLSGVKVASKMDKGGTQ